MCRLAAVVAVGGDPATPTATHITKNIQNLVSIYAINYSLIMYLFTFSKPEKTINITSIFFKYPIRMEKFVFECSDFGIVQMSRV